MNEQLTRSDIRTMARKAADYITFNCDGVSEGFEITHKGYTIFVDYSARLCNDEMSEFTEVPAVWDRAGLVGSEMCIRARSGDRRSLAINVELTD